MRGSAAARL